MQVTIIPVDGFVQVNGYRLAGIDMTGIPLNIHALQWNGDVGELELTDGPNEIINDIAPFQEVINRFNTTKNSIENPQYSLEELKTRQKEMIKQRFLMVPTLGLNISIGLKVNSDRLDKDNMQELLDYCTRMDVSSVTIRLYDNSFTDVSIADLQIIINEIQEFGLGLYQHKWAKETAIDAATSAAEILSITWES